MVTGRTVDYTNFSALWRAYDDLLVDTARREGANDVAELGGGANPIVADSSRWGFARHRVVIDISAEELDKAGGQVETRVADLCQPMDDVQDAYDMVFSKMLCEHLPDARAFHENCLRMLRPGGVAMHFFPTLFAAPFVANRFIPEDAARSLLAKVQSGRIGDPHHEKFPALYQWCTGPTRRSIRRFESVGFQVEAWHGAYGHSYYKKLPPLHAVEQAKTKLLIKHPVPGLTSFATVVLRKPA